MAFASGSVTFRRYRVTQCKFSAIDDAMLDALNANAFSRYGSAADDDVEVGWITPQHLFDVNFAGEKIAVGRFAHFNMRMDRNSVPGSILRSYVEIEQAAALEVSGREYLTKEAKRQAKEAATARAEKEARSGAFRRIAACPILFDLENAMLYFGNTGNAANEKMQRLFIDTFDAALEPITAHHLAARIAESGGQRRNLEDATPAHFIAPPDEVDADVYGLDPEDCGFLGREFLSWLWYCDERSEGMFELPGRNEVATSVAKLMHLKCDFNLSGSVMIRGDAPASMPESRMALASGKQPVKMGLLFGARTGEWDFALDAVRLDVSGLVLPASDERDATARTEERFEAIAELASVIDSLFEIFLRLRLSSGWQKSLQHMMQWVSAGRVDRHVAQPQLALA